MGAFIAAIGALTLWFTILTYKNAQEKRKRQHEKDQNKILQNEIKQYKREINKLNNKFYDKEFQEDDQREAEA
jgi:capsule polysaccharide modification protein KpsS